MNELKPSEIVNDFILLKVTSTSEIDQCYSCQIENKNDISFIYNLNSKDCLLELNGTNYNVTFTVKKEYFSKYDQKFIISEQRQLLCCNVQRKLLEIINCKTTGIQRNILLESLILYLVAKNQSIDSELQSSCSSCDQISKTFDLVKMQQARVFILKNLNKKITIPTIALYVGTNQCYLKKGFKKAFGQTIFEFMLENRMNKAKHLITNSDKVLNEISEIVGYSSMSSFSQSFKHYFGVSPKILKK